MSRSGARGREIGAKGLSTAAFLQTIEMREGMGADLLSGVAENSPDERKAIVIGILLLVRADLGKIVIGRDSGSA